MMYNIYLIRHAETQGNLQKRYAGAADEPLAEQGLERLNERIKANYYPRVEHVFVSPMKRCQQTAEHIYPGSPLEIVPGFAEYNFGEFEGQTYQDLKDNPHYQQWIASGGRTKTPGGEDMESYKSRCCQAFEEVIYKIKEMGYKNTALIVHGGTIMSILEKHLPGEKGFYGWQIANCEGYKLVIGEEGVSIFSISTLNCIQYQ